ncbi:hypothetical protein NL351_28655, partial [Klebsiella pneumoniae]|nr:hypothetical protein [Klebsiella pneumoniae]
MSAPVDRAVRVARRVETDNRWRTFLRTQSRRTRPGRGEGSGRVVLFAMVGKAALARTEASLGAYLGARGYTVEAVFCDASRAA